MSQENVEVVRRSYKLLNAFMRGELTAEDLEELVDPQIELDFDERTLPDLPRHLRGAPAFFELSEQLRSAWVDLTFDSLEFIEAWGDRVLVLTRQSARGRESGVPIVIHFFQLWTIREGRVREIEFFRHRADALEAAGLRE
jgi:ketosteroid isomerase-like protein